MLWRYVTSSGCYGILSAPFNTIALLDFGTCSHSNSFIHVHVELAE